MNGPDVPNVIRYGANFAFGIQDPATNLIAFAGLPANPRNFVSCGGTELASVADVQNAGVRQEVIHALVKADDVALHVYDRAAYRGICVSTPIASGVGRLAYVDNDRDVTGEGANSWGFRMNGAVTLLLEGTSAHLEAHNRFIIWPDGSFRRIYRQVRLTP